MNADENSAYVAGSARRTDAWAEEAAQRGHRGSQRIARAGWIVASAEVAAALAVAEGAAVAYRRRIVLLDERPVEIADAYYPQAVAEGTALPEPARVKGGTAALLADLGWTAAEVHETVSARLPDSDEAEVLQIVPAEPVLILERVSIAADGTAFEYAVMVMNAENRKIRHQTRGR